MSRCPNCHRDLSDDERQAGVCPGCATDLSSAATFEVNAANETMIVHSSPEHAPEPTRAHQQTVDFGETVNLPSASGDDRSDHESSAPITFELVQQTWAEAAATASPAMTIRQSADDAGPANTSSLVIRDREVRQSENDALAMADYDLIAQLGEGGMGVVFTARQASIDRTVAVKMLKPGKAADETQKQKFLSEAVVTGELDHPNIVPIYELGRNLDGSLFYSMKKIQGTRWMDVLPKQTLAENLEVLMKVADAVAFAHARGVVHRDLKPENIMLGEFGEVLVLDWGLALTTPEYRKAHSVDAPIGMGGTPAYMAPEMVLGPADAIGKHSDIYLLGAILYECITGSPPHTGRNAMECLRSVATNTIEPTEKNGELVDIARTAMATSAADRYASVQKFQQAIRQYQSHSESIALASHAADDLAKAQQTDDYRELARALYLFEEACELWPDNNQARQGVLQAKLAYADSAFRKGDFDLGLSVLDHDEPSHRQLASRLERAQHDRNARQQRLRNAKRAIIALATLVFAAVTAGMVLFRIQKNEADRQRAIAVASEREAQTQRDEANRQRDEADRQRALAVRQEAEAKRQETAANQQRARAEVSERDAVEKRRQAEYEAYIAWIGLADSKIKENALGQARSILAQCGPHLRDWEWARLMYQCRQGLSRIQVGERLDCVAISHDASHMAAGSRDGMVRVWDLQQGELTAELRLERSFASSLAFAPMDSTRLAIASGDLDALVRLWHFGQGRMEILPVAHDDQVTCVSYSPDGKHLLTASLDNTSAVWNLAEQRTDHVLRGHSWWVWSAQYSPDGQQIVTASQDGTVRLWDAASGRQFVNDANQPMPFRAHQSAVYSASFSPDGQQIVSGGYDGRVLLWDPKDLRAFDYQALLRNGQQVPVPWTALEGHSAAVSRVRFTQDGRFIVSAGHDNVLRVWTAREISVRGMTLPTATLYKTLRGHDSLVRDLAAFPDANSKWASASYDGQLRIWDFIEYSENQVIPAVVLQGHTDAILQACFSPDDQQIATASRDRTARTWRTTDGHPLGVLREGHAYLTSTAMFYPPPNRKLLTAAVDGTARVWNLDTGTEELVFAGIGPSAAAAVSPNGRWLVTSARRDTVNSGPDHEAKVWDAQTGQAFSKLRGHQAPVTAIAFSPDSSWVFTGDANGRGYVWHVESATPLATLRRHTGRITAAKFETTGRSLVTASEDRTVFRWQLATPPSSPSTESMELDVQTKQILTHPQAVTSLALTSDGSGVVTGGQDGVVRLWDLDSSTTKWEWRSDDVGNINAVDISPQSQLVLVVDSSEQTVHLLDLQTGTELKLPSQNSEPSSFLQLKQHGALGWSAAFSPDGDSVVTVGGDEARLWDLQGRERMSYGARRTVSSVSYSPDGKRLATASWDNSAKIWNVASGVAVLKLDDHVAGHRGGHRHRINSVAYSPTGASILTASDDHTLRIWDAQDGTVLHVLDAHQGPVLYGGYSPDGQHIVSTSRDAEAMIWDASDGRLLHRLSGHRLAVLHAAFSPDGSQVVTGSDDNRAILWDASSGAERQRLPEQTAAVSSVAFSPTGTRVITGGADHSVKVWDAVTGREVLTLTGHQREVTSVCFSSDGRYLLSSGRDGVAMVWPSVAVETKDDPQFDVPLLIRADKR